jgi:polyhydroxyalkanoate synthase
MASTAARYDSADPPPTTAFEVVFEGDLLRLRHYRAEPTSATRGPPVVLVYSLLKRPFILDLLPGRSVVQSFQSRGFSVYLTDWLPPRPEDTARGLESYVEGDLAAAVACVLGREHVERVALVGSCLGGFLAAVYTALHPHDVDRLVTFALPFESRPPFTPATAEFLAQFCGNIPASWLSGALNARVADPRGLPAYLAAELAEPELAKCPASAEAAAVRAALETWFASDVPFAGRLFLDVMGEAYGRGSFAAGQLLVGGRRVAFDAIRCSVLNICAEGDQLVPPAESMPFVHHVGSSDARNLTFPCGHLGLMVGRGAHADLWPHVCRWLQQEAAQSAGPRARHALRAPTGTR